eukprot:CAMPEP_0174380478 /NCGR_PEP_ID=MMETSP0811_2-20130205/123399_1 /TAXON_ID=73025 ORGANISM="Eutreptiella gymnastica-like, Strain CCMP1594" /NCGR_SAMPLE_ID=MMETSP0811_2 /ASSEMBLY_ACC=CAM_ASM_000667 /LENGTH=145 /DNA_ID=CAMNT_0015533361 /DNA_START=861 /DNA_END=1298 /DNA_ORIENTATION=+
MDVDHIDTYPAGAVNFQRSGGSIVPAKIVLATGAGAQCQALCQACSQKCQTRTQLVLSISNVLGAVLCLPRLCLPQGLEPTASSKAAQPRAKPSPMSAAKPAAQVATKSASGEPIPVAPVEHVQLFRVKCPCQKKWHTEPVSEQS